MQAVDGGSTARLQTAVSLGYAEGIRSISLYRKPAEHKLRLRGGACWEMYTFAKC
jgi:hypothetical protein